MIKNNFKITWRTIKRHKGYSFINIFFLSSVAAWPVAFIAMNRWLQSFAYRMNINLWLFILSTLMTLFIALVAVSCLAVRAALANPIDSMRYE